MKINRENFLNNLNMVKAGLSPREFVEQSSCFAFSEGMVMTFNDEIACRMKVDFPVTGAVQASSLLEILEKLDDPFLKVRENEKGELEFRGEKKAFGVTKDAEIFLPIGQVEMPEKWHSLTPDFVEAIGLVQHCVSLDESRFTLTCIHITPDHIEACDNIQILRAKVKTGLKNPILVRGASIGAIASLGMNEVATTKSWIHFRNEAGLIFSCRRYAETYPNLDPLLECEGHPFVLPKGLVEASDRAAVFAVDKSGDPLLSVSIVKGKVRVVGEGLTGWYKEIKKLAYDGPPLEFLIMPSLLRHISEQYSDAHISEDRLKVVGGKWEYVTVLGKPGKQEPSEQEEESDEE